MALKAIAAVWLGSRDPAHGGARPASSRDAASAAKITPIAWGSSTVATTAVVHQAAAARAEAPTLARERHQSLERTIRATQAREAVRHHAAGEEVPELLLHECGQSGAVRVTPGRLEEGIEMLRDIAARRIRHLIISFKVEFEFIDWGIWQGNSTTGARASTSFSVRARRSAVVFARSSRPVRTSSMTSESRTSWTTATRLESSRRTSLRRTRCS
jgi:hypothetical protein